MQQRRATARGAQLLVSQSSCLWDGDPEIPAREVKTAWEAAKAEAGVECRFHDLRHTACTRLLERGASLSVVAAIMGWSASTTAKMAKRYGHIGDGVQRAALDALVESPVFLKAPAASQPPRARS